MDEKKYDENDTEIIDEETTEDVEVDEDIETLEDEAEEIEAEIVDENNEVDELKSTLVRLQADFNNYRNRVNKEKAQTIKFATESLVEKLLPILDDFDRAIDSCKEDPSIVEGFSLIRAQMLKVLEGQGLEIIESDGVEFDPNLHNAVVMEESDEKSGIITETFQKGYKLGDRVLRASMVKVSK